MSAGSEVAPTGVPRSGASPNRTVSLAESAVRICWLSADLMLLTISTTQPVEAPVEVFAELEGSGVPVAVRVFRYGQADSSEPATHTAQAALVRWPAAHMARYGLAITLRWADRTLRLGAEEVGEVTVPLSVLLRSEFAALEPPVRADVLAFLVAGPGDDCTGGPVAPDRDRVDREGAAGSPEGHALQLSENLHAARQALRERLPVGVIAVSAAQGLSVDAVLAIDERSFYVRGWMRDQKAVTTRLTAVSPEGSRTELLPHLFRHRRPDVEQFYNDSDEKRQGLRHGWIAHLQTAAPSRLASGWTFEMANSAGEALEVPAPSVTRDTTAVREQILQDLAHERLPDESLRVEHAAPALTRLEKRRRRAARVECIDQHGTMPLSPDVSIVVPLYGRLDFLEHQLAQFVQDPELRGADLIYVLDSPELADWFRASAVHLAQLYDVPFRAVVLSHNVGFSGVNNIGAELARGRLLLLLNSDVFPRDAGWLGEMSRFYDETPAIGALGPKLLYEDDSIQHAGLYFRRLIETELWNNEHYYKGLHRTLPAANLTRRVPAVTAACMMIDLALYREMGGLRGMYIQGDYEDSDLCMRLSEAGRQIWYLPSVELYHLEGQSFPSGMRQLTGAYNRWLHTHTWRHLMANNSDLEDMP